MNAHPPLPRSCKKIFPFTLAVPSFIYPDHWVPNVRMLGPHVDEIELLLFESRPESLIPADDIRVLAELGRDLSITYNVHLPVDVSLAHPDSAQRKHAVDAIARAVALTEPLHPSAWVLHLPADEPPDHSEDDSPLWTAWRDRAADGLRRLLNCGIPPRKLALETLAYPPERLIPLLDAFGLPLCLDIGHLILAGRDPAEFWETHGERISIVHLHGVSDGRDHRALDLLSPDHGRRLSALLKSFEKIVSVEVFAYKTLVDSLEWLCKTGLGAGDAT